MPTRLSFEDGEESGEERHRPPPQANADSGAGAGGGAEAEAAAQRGAQLPENAAAAGLLHHPAAHGVPLGGRVARVPAARAAAAAPAAALAAARARLPARRPRRAGVRPARCPEQRRRLLLFVETRDCIFPIPSF